MRLFISWKCKQNRSLGDGTGKTGKTGDLVAPPVLMRKRIYLISSQKFKTF